MNGSIYSTGLVYNNQGVGMKLNPLNLGQNKGKFSQLKSLLQSQERVQTSDDIGLLRKNKQVLFDPIQHKLGAGQFGYTGTGFTQNQMLRHQQNTAGPYGADDGAMSNTFDMSFDRGPVSQKNAQFFQGNYVNAAQAEPDTDEAASFARMEYMDSQINQLEQSFARDRSNERSQQQHGGSVDVQRAFKNRVIQYNKLKNN